MGKYIIDIPDDMIVSRELPTLAIKAQFGNMRPFALDTGLKLTPYDDAEQRGAEKAWDLAQKIRLSEISGGMPLVELDKCFGTSSTHEIFSNSYSEVAQMYEAWMNQKKDDEIKVGDEVTDEYSTAVVLGTHGQRVVLFFNSGINSGIVQETYKKNWKKTGRHSPELVEALERLKEE